MSESNQGTTQRFDVEVLAPEPPSSLQALESAAITSQAELARKYRRNLPLVRSTMLSLATLDEETAEGCFYSLKRKDKDGNVKLIQGPSIRLAEVALSSYGNIRAGARLLSNDGKFVTCQGVCHDLENNVYVAMEVTRRITTREGRTYSDDMIGTTINAACAIAIRNAILKVIPGVLTKPVLDAARKVAVGDIRSLSVRRGKILARLKQMGASQDAILAAIECSTVDEVTTDKLEILIGLGTSLKDGDITVEEAFPAVGGKLHSKGAAKPPEPATEAPQTAPEPPQAYDLPPEPTAPVEAPQEPPVPSDPLPKQPAPEAPPYERLVKLVVDAGYSYQELIAYLLNETHLVDPPKGPEGIPAALALRLLRAEKGLLAALKRARS